MKFVKILELNKTVGYEDSIELRYILQDYENCTIIDENGNSLEAPTRTYRNKWYTLGE